MSLYVKVPPHSGDSSCVFKIENPSLKNNVLYYTSFIAYTKMKNITWVRPQKLIDLRYDYRTFNDNPNINIVVCTPGFHKNETVFKKDVFNYDCNIPLIDHMICFYFNVKCEKPLKYVKQNQNTNKVSNDLLWELLEGQKLTKSELRALGLQ